MGLFSLINWSYQVKNKYKLANIVNSMRLRMVGFLLASLLGAAVAEGATIVWTNALGNNVFTSGGNWIGNTAPGSGDLAQIDLSGGNKAVFSETDGTYVIQRAYVGTAGSGRTGELEITGGFFRATVSSTQGTRIGAGGGTGIVNQSGGTAEFGHIVDIGRSGSTGTYNLTGGLLDIWRSAAINTIQTSLQLGDSGGSGRLIVSGGEVRIRAGVQLLSSGASIRINGSEASAITVGGEGEGSWYQASGAVLEVRVNEGGLTPVAVKASSAVVGGDVVFSSGALLDVSFLNLQSDRSGSWDVMRWDGALTDNGLAFAPGVDASIWSFSFVDTDSSGTPDTLRVSAVSKRSLKMFIIH